MPHTPVPAGELNARLSRLRAALAQHDPAWSMTILDNKIDLLLLHRHHAGWRAHRHARPSGAVRPPFIRMCQTRIRFADIRPLSSFRTVAEAFPAIPRPCLSSPRAPWRCKNFLCCRNIYPLRSRSQWTASSQSCGPSKSAYELDCMRQSGAPAPLRAGGDRPPSCCGMALAEARLCSEVSTVLLERGSMGISASTRRLQTMLGVASFSETVWPAAVWTAPPVRPAPVSP